MLGVMEVGGREFEGRVGGVRVFESIFGGICI